jgi:superfamily I DNA/RNA helicase
LFGSGGDRRRFPFGEDTVKLLTYHSSKGLEFQIVFMPFLESMPHMRDDVPGEARLLYVAMTRAMEHLVLTHHGNSAFVGQLREAVRRSAA